MKQIVLTALLLTGCLTAFAQHEKTDFKEIESSAFKAGNVIIDLGAGWISTRAIPDDTELLETFQILKLRVEVGVWNNRSHALGISTILNAMSIEPDLPGGFADFGGPTIAVGPNYHYQATRHVEIYAGALAGIRIGTTYSGCIGRPSPYFAYGAYAGARFYAGKSRRFNVYLETGYGNTICLINAGFGVRLGRR